MSLERGGRSPLDDIGLERFIEHVRDGVLVFDRTGRLLIANSAALRIVGSGQDGLDDVTVKKLLGHVVAVHSGAEHRAPLEVELRHVDSPPSWAEFTLSSFDAGKSTGAVIAIVRDVTARKAHERDLIVSRLYDPLTRLPNRVLFLDRLEHALAALARRRSTCGVLLLDIDRFKEVNGALGHAAGDELLQVFARRLRSVLRSGDTLARFGEDQFVILTPSHVTRGRITGVAERLQRALLRPFALAGRDHYVTITVGAAIGGREASPDELLRRADIALHDAKRIGPGHVRIFAPSGDDPSIARLNLEADLHRAVERQEFEVYYQPQFALDDDRILGFEALVRWRHPELGLQPPAEFLAIAEATGLIVPIGRWVLREAARQVGRWQAAFPGTPALRVGVNLSAREILEPGLLEAIRSVIDESSLAACSLDLELVETALLETSGASISFVAALADLGATFSIDDFGTGYSFLSHLRDYPVHAVKIDRSFVARLNRSGEDRVIVEGVVRLAHELGVSVVAEGIETVEQREILREIGCDAGQGYLVAPPLTARAASQLLQRRARPPRHPRQASRVPRPAGLPSAAAGSRLAREPAVASARS